jgi:hypothetical protein
MIVKKKYNIGDIVWIYGINRNNIKSTQGIVIKKFTIDYKNYNNEEPHYLIEVPTEIEPLLEVRTWHTISQTKDGHVGSIRETFIDHDAALKMLARVGMDVVSSEEFVGDGHDGMGTTSEEFDRYYENMVDEEDDIDPNLIHAAMERSQQSSVLPPLNLKDPRPKKRHFTRKKKV